jgi:hypothetical protein
MKLKSTGITHIYSTGVPMAKPDAIQYDKDGNEMAHWRFNPSAPEQEPVAYDKTELNCFAQDLYDQKMREGKRGHYESMFHVIHQCVKKVAPPPQRTWVGLTDEEVESYWGWEDFQCGCGRGTLLDMVRDIDAKLKERNT